MKFGNRIYGLLFSLNVQENGHFGQKELFLPDLKATFLVGMTEITKNPWELIEFSKIDQTANLHQNWSMFEFWLTEPLSLQWPAMATGESDQPNGSKTCSNFDKDWQSSQFFDVDHNRIFRFS